MTKDEFRKIATYLKAAYYSEKFMSDGNMLRVWFSEFGALRYEDVAKAARYCVLTSRYPPSIKDMLDAVGTVTHPMEPTSAEAWGIVLKAVMRYGYMREEEALASMPKLVAEVTKRFGYRSICESEEASLSVVRGQFERQYAQTRDRKHEVDSVDRIEAGLSAKLNGMFSLEGECE